MNPWYFMYQPVSYKLGGRMGSRDDLRKMIKTCRSLGVRVYADAVVNHMTGGGNDANPNHRNPDAGCQKFGAKSSSLSGGSSSMYTQNYAYTTILSKQLTLRPPRFHPHLRELVLQADADPEQCESCEWSIDHFR